MIFNPYQMSALARACVNDESAANVVELKGLLNTMALNRQVGLLIPEYWAGTVFTGLRKIKDEFPQVKISSVMEVKGRLRVVAVPCIKGVEYLLVELANDVDDLILRTLDRWVKGDSKPHWLRSKL